MEAPPETKKPESCAATFVTALFDLGKRENNGKRRQIDEYLHHGQFLLEQPINLIIFADPELAPDIWYIRRKKDLLAQTCLITFPLEQSPYYSLLAEIAAARKKNPTINNNEMKNTPLYTVVGWTKFHLLRQACQDNPFNSTHFAWIDFGLAHVADTSFVEEDKPFNITIDKVRLLHMRSFKPAEVNNKDFWARHIFGNICAGYITAGRSQMLQFCHHFDRISREWLAVGYAPLEDHFFPVIILAQPDLFDFYYGDYKSLLSNYKHLRQDFNTMLFDLRCCRDNEDYERGCHLGRMIVKDYPEFLKISVVEFSFALEEYYINAFYHNQQLAKEVARRYIHLAHNNAIVAKQYKANKNNLDANFGFLQLRVSDYRLSQNRSGYSGNADIWDMNFDIKTPGYNPMNWFILKTKTGYLAIIRAVNYIINWWNGSSYTYTDSGNSLNSKLFLFELSIDSLSQPVATLLGEITENSGRKIHSSCYSGWEDPRVFYWQPPGSVEEQVWLSATISTHEDNGIPIIALAKLDLTQRQLTEVHVLPRHPNANMEKNWLPFIDHQQLKFIWGWSPFKLAQPVLDKEPQVQFQQVDQVADLAGFKGSAPPIPFDQGYLVLTHFSYQFEGRYYYRHQIVWLDQAWQVKKMTLPFYFECDMVEFCLGWTLTTDSILFSTSSLDHYPKLVRLTVTELQLMLH